MLLRRRKTKPKVMAGNVFTLPRDSRRWRDCLNRQKETFKSRWHCWPKTLYVGDSGLAKKLRKTCSFSVGVERNNKLGGLKTGQAVFVR